MAYKQKLETLWLETNDQFHDLMYHIKMVERSIRNMEDDRGFARTEQEIQAWHEERNEAIAYLDELEEDVGKLDDYLSELEETIRNADFRVELVTFRQIQ